MRRGRKAVDVTAPAAAGLPPRFTVRHASAEPAEDTGGWRITDGNGDLVADGLASRRLATRMMASYAAKRPLPLRVEDASGTPTGDRLG
jgi:hypothetical protein